MAVDLGTAYISLVPTTKDLDKGVRKALDNTVKHADKAGDGMGLRIAAGVTSHLGKAGTSSGAAFGKTFTPQVLGAGKNAMLGLANLMSGLATGMGSRVGGGFATSMAAGVASGSGAAVRALGGVSAAASGATAGIAAAGAAAVAAVAAIGVAGAAATAKLYQMGSQWDDISDGIVVKTGLIGAEFDKLTKSIDNVVGRTAAAPGAVADVASTLVQTLGLQGDALEKATLQISDYNDMNIQSPLNVREFSKVMKQFKVSSQNIPDVLDRLNIVAQNTGIPLNELISLMKTAGPQAKQFGLSMDGLANLMATFESAGLDASSTAIALRTALQSLAEKKPGQDPVTALKNTVAEIQRLQQAGNETAAIDLAKSTFGRGWAQISDLIRDNRFDLDQMNSSVDTSGRRVSDIRKRTADWREDWKRLKNTIEEALKPLTTTIFDNLQKALIKVNDWIRDLFNLPNVGPTGTANAAPGGGAPFNPGPMAPGAKSSPGGASGMPDMTLGVDAGAALGAGQAAKQGIIKGSGTPYGLPVGTDTKGYGNPDAAKVFPDWVMQLGNRFGVKPSTYGGHQESTGMNRGIDWVGSVEQMQAFAEFLTSSNIPGLEQVIWQNPTTKKPLGLTPDGQVVTVPDGYYRDDWADHQNHVHTRFSQNLDLSGFSSGGHVWGSGSATSDSIPAMLSNGEHVLTADDVKKLGGQSGVYAFRAALQNGLIPGFAPGGAVDPSQIQDAQDNLYDLDSARTLAQKQLAELPSDATPVQRLQAQLQAEQAQRDWEQAAADLPLITAGMTPPDRSLQNDVASTSDQAKLALAQLDDLRKRKVSGEDISPSDLYAAEAAANAAQRDRQQALTALKNPAEAQQTNYGNEFLRTLGFIPAAAGNTSVAGTSSLAQFIGMGNDIVGGLIDTGTNLAQTAVSAAITAGATAGSFGAAAPAAPFANAAASYGIQLAGQTAKRLSAYGFQLLGIGADALVEQLFPFGSPRWIGYDYGQFAPQLNIMGAATSTLEKMGTDAINKHFQPKPAAADPNSGVNTDPSGPSAMTSAPPVPLQSNQQLLQPGDPGFYTPPAAQTPPIDPMALDLLGGAGSFARGGQVGIYDNGGMLPPGQAGINLTSRPEPVLTPQQWDAIAASSGTPVKNAPLVENLYAQDMQDAIRQLEKVKRRDMMQYAGRP